MEQSETVLYQCCIVGNGGEKNMRKKTLRFNYVMCLKTKEVFVPGIRKIKVYKLVIGGVIIT